MASKTYDLGLDMVYTYKRRMEKYTHGVITRKDRQEITGQMISLSYLRIPKPILIKQKTLANKKLL